MKKHWDKETIVNYAAAYFQLFISVVLMCHCSNPIKTNLSNESVERLAIISVRSVVCLSFLLMVMTETCLTIQYSSHLLTHTKQSLLLTTRSIISSQELQHIQNSSQRHVTRQAWKPSYIMYMCVFSWVQTISSSTVKTLKYCVMLSSAVFLTSCTSWLSLQNRVWTGSLCQRAMSPALSFCHQLTPSLLQGL